AIVANVGRVAVDAEVPTTNGTNAYGEIVWSRRLGAGVKSAVSPADDGGKKADHRGEHAISRKAIAQGMSDALRCPVCSCAHFLVHIARETAGAARIRHSLRPLISLGAEDRCKARAHCVARMRTHIQLSSPGLTGRPRIPATPM